MIKKILIITAIFLATFTTSPAYGNDEVSVVAKKWFTSFSSKVAVKNTTEKEIAYFEVFSKRLNNLILVKDFNEAQTKLVNDLIKLSNEYIFRQEKYLREQSSLIQIKNNSLVSNFKKKSYNDSHIFLENGVWYTYRFKSHLYFGDSNVNLNQPTFDLNKISRDTSVIFVRADGKFGFVNDYEKVKLISDSIIYGIPGKYNFLKEIKDDKKTLNSETDNAFIALKEITKNLTDGKTEEEKIKIIYDYVISNVEYTKDFTLDQARVFSGIHTFAKKDGVCEGYVKLFLYMLNFSNLNHSEVIRGYVLDATDFPDIGHAWIKIGDKYYDPTFDDPVGQSATKEFSEYDYYGLPYDLFYVNRYTFDKIPSFLKEETLEYRKNFIFKRTVPLVSKYQNSGYNILKPFKFRQDNGIELDKKLELEELKKAAPYHEVSDWEYIENGKSYKIKNLSYYTITDETTEDIILQLDYDLEGYHLLRWTLENGSYEYRLAYNLKFN